MQYFINGDQVSEDTFERDAEDNFNAGIAGDITVTGDITTMNYKDEE